MKTTKNKTKNNVREKRKIGVKRQNKVPEAGMLFHTKVPDRCSVCGHSVFYYGFEEGSPPIMKDNKDGTIEILYTCSESHLFKVIYTPTYVVRLVNEGGFLGR